MIRTTPDEQRRSRRAPRLAALLLLGSAGICLAAEPAEQARAERPVRIAKPVVRIGLSVPIAHVSLSATGPFRVLGRYSHDPVARDVYKGEEIVLVTDRPKDQPLVTVFRVQIASTTDRQAAEALRDRLAERFDEPVTVEPFTDRRSYRVRVGEARTRQEASALAERLRSEAQEDVSETWVIEEPLPVEDAQAMRLVDARYHDTLIQELGAWIVPTDSSQRVIVEGREYRGIVEVFTGSAGQLIVVNHLPLEEYLRGVVPNELGPEQYPELEALKAQTVAARTYVVRNLGQFGDEGYDLCDSQRCQVYRGYRSEHPMTDMAIRQTRGQILLFEGAPINAMYTAACGGHTEEGRLVFPEETGAYLRGVACYPEQEEARASAWTLSTKRRLSSEEIRSAEETYQATLLHVLGMLPARATERSWLEAAAETREIRSWTFRTLRLIGKRPGRHDYGSLPIATRSDLARYWVQVFSWEERVSRLLSEPDVEALLSFADGAEVPQVDRARLAYLLREGWYEPREDGLLWPGKAPRRADVVRGLYRILERYEALDLESGRILTRNRASLEVRSGRERTRLNLDASIHLFRRTDGRTLPATEMGVQVGDAVLYHADGNNIKLLVLEDPRRGASDDRFDSGLWWEMRLTREEAEKRVRRRSPEVGQLIDLIPLEYGPSQRVTRLKIAGSRRSTELVGFKIRMALGLREDVFVMDRQYDANGKVAVFVFSGKGRGHGVGMCQVGAYGMALRGKSYRDILMHYYRGVELKHFF
ncbi:MAG: SpoIID/LytB domain-containing protein [Acidobacteriota bacterium]